MDAIIETLLIQNISTHYTYLFSKITNPFIRHHGLDS